MTEKAKGQAEPEQGQGSDYVPPAIIWEQTFMALMQVSVPPPMCMPGDPPPCP